MLDVSRVPNFHSVSVLSPLNKLSSHSIHSSYTTNPPYHSHLYSTHLCSWPSSHIDPGDKNDLWISYRLFFKKQKRAYKVFYNDISLLGIMVVVWCKPSVWQLVKTIKDEHYQLPLMIEKLLSLMVHHLKSSNIDRYLN